MANIKYKKLTFNNFFIAIAPGLQPRKTLFKKQLKV